MLCSGNLKWWQTFSFGALIYSIYNEARGGGNGNLRKMDTCPTIFPKKRATCHFPKTNEALHGEFMNMIWTYGCMGGAFKWDIKSYAWVQWARRARVQASEFSKARRSTCWYFTSMPTTNHLIYKKDPFNKINEFILCEWVKCPLILSWPPLVLPKLKTLYTIL